MIEAWVGSSDLQGPSWARRAKRDIQTEGLASKKAETSRQRKQPMCGLWGWKSARSLLDPGRIGNEVDSRQAHMTQDPWRPQLPCWAHAWLWVGTWATPSSDLASTFCHTQKRKTWVSLYTLFQALMECHRDTLLPPSLSQQISTLGPELGLSPRNHECWLLWQPCATRTYGHSCLLLWRQPPTYPPPGLHQVWEEGQGMASGGSLPDVAQSWEGRQENWGSESCVESGLFHKVAFVGPQPWNKLQMEAKGPFSPETPEGARRALLGTQAPSPVKLSEGQVMWAGIIFL